MNASNNRDDEPNIPKAYIDCAFDEERNKTLNSKKR